MSPSPSKSPQAAARVSVTSATPDGRRDVGERAAVVAIEPVGLALLETDEQVEVAVVVDVGPGVRLRSGGRKQVGLHRLEGQGGLREGNNESGMM